MIKSVTQTIKNETRKQNDEFLGTLLGTLVTSLWANILTGKGVNRTDDGVLRGEQDF